MKKSLFPIICFLCTAPALAQSPDLSSPWTLQQCITYALEHNLSIKQAALNQQISQADYLQSKANLFPTLNANASHIYNFGRTIDPFTNQFATDRILSQNFSLSTSLLLFGGFQNQNLIQQQKYSVLASQQDLEKMKYDISLSIATAYLQILFAEELLTIAKGQTATTKLQVDRTKKLVDAGSLSKSILLDIEAQLATEELNLVNSENSLAIAYLNLAQMLDLQDTKNFRIVRPELSTPDAGVLSLPPDQIYSIALTGMPEIKSSEFKVLSSQKALTVSKGGMSPRLTFSGSIGTGYSGASKELSSLNLTGGWDTTEYFTSSGDFVLIPEYTTTYNTISFADQVDQNFNRNFGFHLTIPIFNGLQTRTNIQRSKIGLLNSQLQLEQTKNTLRKNIQQAHADALAALKKYEASQKSVSALQESFKYMEQRFNENLVNSFDYADAKNRLARASSEMAQAKYDFFFKLKVLEYYQGKPLQF